MRAKLFSVLTTLTLLLVSGHASALACLQQGSNEAKIMESIPTNVAIPSDAADGSIIWESKTYTINVHCYHDWGPNSSEQVYFYVNPANQALAVGTKVGIRYNGSVSTQATGRVDTGKTILAGQDLDFPMTFSVVVLKSGTSPASGLSTFSQFRAFQLDGVGGINANPATNLNFVIDGTVRFIGCMATLGFSPSDVIDFGSVDMAGASGSTAGERSFTLTATKTCASPYALRISFSPTSSTPSGAMLDDYTYKLTNGLGLTLLDAARGNQAIKAGQFTDFVDLSSSLTASNPYVVRLTRSQLPLTAGPFTVQYVIDLEYR